jgi:hypothetical protein
MEFDPETEKETKILINKDGMRFEKFINNTFKLSFTIENKNINLAQIINLDLIKLVYDLNPDIYEKVIFQKTNENEANIILIMKHFFIDLGLPQRYSHFNMKKGVKPDGTITFTATSITDVKPFGIPDEVELVPMENMNVECKLETPHRANFTSYILFNKKLTLPPFVEKMVGILVNKIFNRVKLFIENVVIN